MNCWKFVDSLINRKRIVQFRIKLEIDVENMHYKKRSPLKSIQVNRNLKTDSFSEYASLTIRCHTTFFLCASLLPIHRKVVMCLSFLPELSILFQFQPVLNNVIMLHKALKTNFIVHSCSSIFIRHFFIKYYRFHQLLVTFIR